MFFFSKTNNRAKKNPGSNVQSKMKSTKTFGAPGKKNPSTKIPGPSGENAKGPPRKRKRNEEDIDVSCDDSASSCSSFRSASSNPLPTESEEDKGLILKYSQQPGNLKETMLGLCRDGYYSDTAVSPRRSKRENVNYLAESADELLNLSYVITDGPKWGNLSILPPAADISGAATERIFLNRTLKLSMPWFPQEWKDRIYRGELLTRCSIGAFAEHMERISLTKRHVAEMVVVDASGASVRPGPDGNYESHLILRGVRFREIEHTLRFAFFCERLVSWADFMSSVQFTSLFAALYYCEVVENNEDISEEVENTEVQFRLAAESISVLQNFFSEASTRFWEYSSTAEVQHSFTFRRATNTVGVLPIRMIWHNEPKAMKGMSANKRMLSYSGGIPYSSHFGSVSISRLRTSKYKHTIVHRNSKLLILIWQSDPITDDWFAMEDKCFFDKMDRRLNRAAKINKSQAVRTFNATEDLNYDLSDKDSKKVQNEALKNFMRAVATKRGMDAVNNVYISSQAFQELRKELAEKTAAIEELQDNVKDQITAAEVMADASASIAVDLSGQGAVTLELMKRMAQEQVRCTTNPQQASERSNLVNLIEIVLARAEGRARDTSGGNQTAEASKDKQGFVAGYRQSIDQVKAFSACREIDRITEALNKGVPQRELEAMRGGPSAKIRRLSEIQLITNQLEAIGEASDQRISSSFVEDADTSLLPLEAADSTPGEEPVPTAESMSGGPSNLIDDAFRCGDE